MKYVLYAPEVSKDGYVKLEYRIKLYTWPPCIEWSCKHARAGFTEWRHVATFPIPMPFPSRRNKRAQLIKTYADMVSMQLGYPYRLRRKL